MTPIGNFAPPSKETKRYSYEDSSEKENSDKSVKSDSKQVGRSEEALNKLIEKFENKSISDNGDKDDIKYEEECMSDILIEDLNETLNTSKVNFIERKTSKGSINNNTDIWEDDSQLNYNSGSHNTKFTKRNSNHNLLAIKNTNSQNSCQTNHSFIKKNLSSRYDRYTDSVNYHGTLFILN